MEVDVRGKGCASLGGEGCASGTEAVWGNTVGLAIFRQERRLRNSGKGLGEKKGLVLSTHPFDMLIATLSKRFDNALTPSVTLTPVSLPYRCVATCLDASVENIPGPLITIALG